MTLARLPNPTHYRFKTCADILTVLASGRSCTLIGVGSSGKSNVARHLTRRDALDLHIQKYLGQAGHGMACVLVDFQHYAEDDATGLHCLLIESLVKSAQAPDALPELAAAVTELRDVLDEAHAAGDNAKRTRFCLGEAVRLAFAHGLKRLVFVLDDFDNGLKRAPGAALNGLRGLRDDYKEGGRLAYVAVMRREMAFVRENTADYEDFYELVNKPVFAVGALDDDDAFDMINSLAGGKTKLSLLEQRWLLELTGGHPGLLRKLFFAADAGKIPFNMANIVDAVSARSDVQVECELIWDSLDAQERAALRAIATGGTVDDGTAGRLRFKTLLRDDTQGATGGRFIFSPIFARFVRSQPADVAPATAKPSPSPAPSPTPTPTRTATPPRRAEVTFNHAARTAHIDGRTIAPLDEIEYHLLERLYQRRSQAVPMRELLEVLLSYQKRVIKRFPGSPERQLYGYMQALMGKINLPDRTYVDGEVDGSYRFVEAMHG